ncbi:hypothetical protein ACO0SA_000008 [Hanseniaspora valbyensis]
MGMDFESLLFELTPLFDPNVQNLSKNQTLHQNILTGLDKLAVALRSEFNRDLVRESGLLSKLCNVQFEIDITDVFSEIIRCLANAVADNDSNREIIIKNTDLLNTVKKIIDNFDYLTDSTGSFEICKRSLILLRNLFIEEIPKDKKVLESFVSSFMSYILNNCQNIAINLNNEYLSEVSKIVYDLLSSFLDDEKIYTEKTFYEKCVPPYPQMLTLLEEYSKRITKMGDLFKDHKEGDQEEEDDDDDEYEEPSDLTNIIFMSEIIEKLLKKSIQLTEENESLNGLKLLLSSLNNLENCNFQFPSKLILLRRISFIIQCITSNLALDLPDNDFRNQLPFDLTIYSFENIFNLFQVISKDESVKNYQISVLSFIISNMLDDKTNLKKWQSAYSITKYIHLVYETYQYSDPYLYIPILDLIRKSVSIINIIDDPKALELVWKFANDHIVERLDLIQDLARFYKLMMNKLLAIEYGQLLFESNILAYEKLYCKDYVMMILLISKLSKYLLQSDNNKKLFDMIDKSIDGVTNESEKVSNVLPEFFKAVGVYIREYSLVNNNNLVFYLSENKLKFIHLLKMVVNDKEHQSPATLNNLKFCIGMVISNDNVKNKFEEEDVSILKELFGNI